MFKTAQAKALVALSILFASFAGYQYLQLKYFKARVEHLQDTVALQEKNISTLRFKVNLDEVKFQEFSLGRNMTIRAHQTIEDNVDKALVEIARRQDLSDQERRRAVDVIQVTSLWSSYCATTPNPKCESETLP